MVYFIFAMAVLFIIMGKGCNPGNIRGNDFLFDKEAQQSMAMAVAFHSLVFWSIMLCGLVSSATLSREIEESTAFLTLSRPLSRSAFIAGKVLSSLILSAFNLFLLGGIFFLLFYSVAGYSNFRIFLSFSFMIVSLCMYTLMNILFSLFIPRIITPLVSSMIYLVTCWAALPFYFTKLRIVWAPSETVKNIHRFFPGFGDLQFMGASFIESVPAVQNLSGTLCNVFIYCAVFWFLIAGVFNRRQL